MSAQLGGVPLASATMTMEELTLAVAKVKERTSKPFGVNMRADQADIRERCELLIREGVRVASFAAAPRKDVIQQLKDGGVLTVPTIGKRRHAEKVAAWGVDAVIAQGHEGGGHTGPVPTSLLLSEVCEAVDIPVIGAGGFRDGRGLVAALAWGAAGVAMGTRFLLTVESTVPEAVKARYLKASVTDSVVTTAIDGYPQRVIRTELVDKLERSGWFMRLWRSLRYAWAFRGLTGSSMSALFREGMTMRRKQELSWAQVAMAANAPMMTRATMVDGDLGAGILPTGQVAGCIDELPTVSDLLARIMGEAEETLLRLGSGSLDVTDATGQGGS